MEEKDVNSIASAVTSALAKLNAGIKEAKQNETEFEIFKCPECHGEVLEGIPYCSHCGCALEWEE